MSHIAITHQNPPSGTRAEDGFEHLSRADLERRALWLAAVSKRVLSPEVADVLRGYAFEMTVEAEVRKRISLVGAGVAGSEDIFLDVLPAPARLPPWRRRQGAGPQ